MDQAETLPRGCRTVGVTPAKFLSILYDGSSQSFRGVVQRGGDAIDRVATDRDTTDQDERNRSPGNAGVAGLAGLCALARWSGPSGQAFAATGAPCAA